MSFVTVAPEFVGQAAADLEGIGSELSTANAAAAAATTGLIAPGADEVSLAITAIFGTHARQYQALSAQAATFHSQFVSMLNVGAGSYVSTEVANAQQSLVNAVNAPSRALLGHPLIGTGTRAAGSQNAGLGASGGAAGPTVTGGAITSGVMRAAAMPAVTGMPPAYQNLIANTVANLQGIGNTFVNVTEPVLLHAITGYPELIIMSLQSGNLLPILNIPVDLAQGFATVTRALTTPVYLSGVSLTPPNISIGIGLGLQETLAFDALGAPVNAAIAAAHSASAIADAVQAGNSQAAMAALVAAPADIANGLLNGQFTLSRDLQLPGLSATANVPFGGLLVPLEPLSASVTVPGLPLIHTVTVTGPPIGGVVFAVVNYVPAFFAEALGP
jgi:hypothetical protein